VREEPKYPVQTVTKAIELINTLAQEPGSRGLGVSDLAARLKMGKSTVHRLLDTLQYYGYVDKNEDSNLYRLGWQLYYIGQSVPLQNQIYNIDQSHLLELNKAIQETVNLGILQSHQTSIISKVEGFNPSFRVIVQQAEREAIHATSLGKILISEFSDDEILKLIESGSGFFKLTDRTITDPDEFLREIEKVRQQGYAVDDQEFAIGLRCLARPIRDYTGRIIAAISVSTPIARSTEEQQKLVLELMHQTCTKISNELGYRG